MKGSGGRESGISAAGGPIASKNLRPPKGAKTKGDSRSSPDYADTTKNFASTESCRLAALLVRQGKREEARLHFAEALRLQPDSKEAQQGLRSLQDAGIDGVE